MEEDIIKIKLEHHDEEIKEIKVEVKNINKSIIEIEKTDIRILIDVQSILDTYKVMRNATITFIVINILTMLWTLKQ